MNNQNRLAPGLAAAALAAVAATATAVPQPLKIGTLAPEGSSWHRGLQEMGEAWRAASAETPRLRLYPGGVLGDEPDMVLKMRQGLIQGGLLTAVGLAHIDPAAHVLALPMTFNSYEELDHVRDKLKPMMEDRFRRQGFEILLWGDGGWVTFFGRETILQPADVKGVKLLVWDADRLGRALWASAGIQPVLLTAADVLPGLQSGRIDAFCTTPLTAMSLQWFQLAPRMTELRWAPLTGATILTREGWERIPASARPAVLEAARKTEARMKDEIRIADARAVAIMKQKGLTVETPSSAQREAWERFCETAVSSLVGQVIPEDVYREGLRHRDTFRSERK